MDEMQGWRKETDKEGTTTYFKTFGLLRTLTITRDKSKFWGDAMGVDERGLVEVSQDERGWHKRIIDLVSTPNGDIAVEEGDFKRQTIKEDEIPNTSALETSIL